MPLTSEKNSSYSLVALTNSARLAYAGEILQGIGLTCDLVVTSNSVGCTRELNLHSISTSLGVEYIYTLHLLEPSKRAIDVSNAIGYEGWNEC
jgi:hypothetical protein